MRKSYCIGFFLLLITAATQSQEIKKVLPNRQFVELLTSEGKLLLYPVDNNAVRIKFLKDNNIQLPELVFTSTNEVPKFKLNENSIKVELICNKISVIVDKKTGRIEFKSNDGKIFLREKENSRLLILNNNDSNNYYIAEQSFETPQDEYLFGLGQFQDGHFNLRGITRRLTQVNTQIAIPFVYSSKGYGLLWHQYGLTDYNPADNFITLEKNEKAGGDENMVEVTTTAGTQKVSQNQSLYTGKFSVPVDGEYAVFLDLGDMGNRHFVAIDEKPCIDQSNLWLPPTVSTIVKLSAGEHKVQVICKSDNHPKLSWKLKNDYTVFRSPHAQMIDYVVFYGPSADEVIASYRKLSGNAPLIPLWAYGFWQCRERYTSGKHLVETVKEFRTRNIPMDVIVQDWQYWGNKGWGVPVFDDKNYPNPSGFIKELHDMNAHFVISIWSNPDKNSELGKKYQEKNLYIPDSKWLDYFNPETRTEYWKTLNENMFVHGVDGWWMDATEPENDDLKGRTTYMGSGNSFRLTYPLMVSKAVYEGQKATTNEKRVCILTRSAFLGQQRYGIINWSGDIGGDWDAFKRQIKAGLNYTVTGLPYWTTDIGGFFRPGNSQYTDENYHELLIRWFQYGVFNPVFRVHAYQTETEPWKYGENTENNIRKAISLRYLLLPYIYSEAFKITNAGSTLMRPLVMDFREDATAVSQPYEFMFGRSLLVAPITEAKVDSWEIYLPKNTLWYDFWTGEKYEGGQTIKKTTPIDIIPLFVKAGTILPIGPKVQYVAEQKWDNLEIRIYEGADGEFTLYEDEGDSYNYEKGAYSTITFKWNDARKTLIITERNGSFAGMLNERKFNIIKVSKNEGLGAVPSKKYDKTISYNGKEIKVIL